MRGKKTTNLNKPGIAVAKHCVSGVALYSCLAGIYLSCCGGSNEGSRSCSRMVDERQIQTAALRMFLMIKHMPSTEYVTILLYILQAQRANVRNLCCNLTRKSWVNSPHCATHHNPFSHRWSVQPTKLQIKNCSKCRDSWYHIYIYIHITTL